ncbi:hypothetical protein RHSIM_Rhsim07G0113900 [Rhododendron simsii]|uniref:Uncharacterized protein n=1 Tax=Rhododendron simsii TaxID=118357 RepID=A0A834LJE5_RHOSS|nr:hypothetical protein RHSIM_Rhsim07G0113900 [Rhododendron simsii]
MPNLEHDVFDFLLKALLNLLGLHYQGNCIASPFQEHPVTMGIASASLLLYCIFYELEPRFTRVGRGPVVEWGCSVRSSLYPWPLFFSETLFGLFCTLRTSCLLIGRCCAR